MENHVLEASKAASSEQRGSEVSRQDGKKTAPRRAWLTKASVAQGGSVAKEYVPEIDNLEKFGFESVRFASRIGWIEPLSAEERSKIPKMLLVGRTGSGKVPGILGWSGGPFIVNQRVRDILDELEPNVHTLQPITVKARDGKQIEGAAQQTYYIVLQPPILDCIDYDGTTWGPRGTGRAAYEKYRDLGTGLDHTITLRAQMISGHHFWRAPPPYSTISSVPTN